MRADKVAHQTVSFIEEHIEEALSLDKIAAALNYSKFYIARSFAQETGCTIYRYIRGRRLTIAARKLVETQKPIIEIAYEAQYDSQQAFTLAFGRLYQCTPQAYRRNGVFYPRQQKIQCGRKGGVMAA